jgi:hypothetical protein
VPDHNHATHDHLFDLRSYLIEDISSHVHVERFALLDEPELRTFSMASDREAAHRNSPIRLSPSIGT